MEGKRASETYHVHALKVSVFVFNYFNVRARNTHRGELDLIEIGHVRNKEIVRFEWDAANDEWIVRVVHVGVPSFRGLDSRSIYLAQKVMHHKLGEERDKQVLVLLLDSLDGALGGMQCIGEFSRITPTEVGRQPGKVVGGSHFRAGVWSAQIRKGIWRLHSIGICNVWVPGFFRKVVEATATRRVMLTALELEGHARRSHVSITRESVTRSIQALIGVGIARIGRTDESW